MPQLTLFCSPGACSRATMIALEEAAVPYDTRVTNLAKGEQRTPAYLAINPKGKVPTLLIDGATLTESVAILSWIAETYPAARLLPRDAWQRAEAVAAIGWLASAVLTAFGRMVRPERISDEASAADRIRAIAFDDVRASLGLAEQRIAGREWWLDEYSIADPYLYYIVCNASGRFGMDFEGFPSLVAHRLRMEGRPATQRMIAWEQRTREALAI